ncbi:EpsG family protein [Clostridium perfringens]|uniref:EpsG family protein n=1 Tax=Clostridium perfringens TaxID=1502 RepID=UPI001CC5FC41|nr:EpsG family protein [Clostridium perfringens]CAG9355494.1 polysaccharide polymerase [Clostridium perfringens]
MGLYYFLIILIIGLALIIFQNNIKNTKNNLLKKLYIIPVFSFLAFISMFRASFIGNDTIQYLNIFENLKFYEIKDFKGRYELGYIFLNKLILNISDNSQLILIITSFFIIFSYSRFIYKYSNNIWLSMLLYFCLGYFGNSMNIIRQEMAIAILFFAYDFLIRRKFLKFVVIVFIASLFHQLSIIFIIAYPISKLKLNFNTILVFLSVTILGVLLFNPILSMLMKFTKYNYYLDSVYLDGEIRLASVLNIMILIITLIFGLIINKYYNVYKFDNCVRIMTLFLLMGTVISIISLRFNLLDRVANYFSVFIIIYLPNIVDKIKNKWISSLFIVIITTLFVAYFLTVQYLKPDWNSIYPYYFFWD